MELSNILIAVCTVLTTLGSLKLWVFSSINNRFDSIDLKLEKLEQRIEKIEQRMEKIEHKIENLDRRLSTLEGYLMGRSFRNGTEK